MSFNQNRIELSGKIYAEPLLKESNGMTRLEISIVNKFTIKTKQGTKEEVFFTKITLWGNQAIEGAQTYKKGQTIYVVGRIVQREYEKDSIKRVAYNIVPTDITLVHLEEIIEEPEDAVMVGSKAKEKINFQPTYSSPRAVQVPISKSETMRNSEPELGSNSYDFDEGLPF